MRAEKIMLDAQSGLVTAPDDAALVENTERREKLPRRSVMCCR